MRPDAPATREEIARAIALEEQHKRSQPANEAAGRGLAERFYRDCLLAQPNAVEPDLLGFIEHISQERSVTNEDRGPDRTFWAYQSQPEGADRDILHRFLARACGESRGLQVLEDTPAGNQLNAYHLGNPHVMDALAEHYGVDSDELGNAHGQAWNTLSDRYARETEGLAVTFAADITEGSVLGKIEIARLLKNSKVGKEGIKFATLLPLEGHEHLPPDVHGFMSNDAVRCQLRKGDDDPQKSPEEFAKKLAAIDVPEDQKEAHRGIVARLSAAQDYQDLMPPPEPKQQGPSKRAKAFMPGVSMDNGIPPAAPSRGPTGHGVMNPVAAGLAPKPAGIEH
ncbi:MULTISPECIES: hypothetical protein [unclassified Streptomyces]|uniref:hypothetical protein n=1 Tax=Streptomyces sp. NPDC017949 TaxID=3365020 RepID=UPI00378A647E